LPLRSSHPIREATRSLLQRTEIIWNIAERWIHEIKFDGYRVQVHIHGGGTKVFTCRGHDWIKRFRKIATDAFELSAGSAVIDSEIVVPDETASRISRFCRMS
jgi:ATP-dependent DNA ligase